MRHVLEIKPAIPVTVRLEIEDLLETSGYNIHGGGTDADKSACNIYFSKGPNKKSLPGSGDVIPEIGTVFRNL